MGKRKNRKSIAVIDAETDPFEVGVFPQPFIWGFYDGASYEEFTSTDDLIRFLYDKEIIVYAHNGGKFDYHFILDYLEEYEPVNIISGRLAKFKIGACEFRDSYNILPVPLRAWEKDDFDYSILKEGERHKPHNWKKIQRYLYSDCLHLYDMVTQFENLYGRNLTQAGASMKVWREMEDIKPPRSSPEYYHYFAPFYYGGRVQCFQQGIIEKPFRLIDINSAYPRAMLEKHPFSLQYHINGPDVAPDSWGPELVKVQGKAKGCFPYRIKGHGSNDGLYYPSDDTERVYFVTGWELQAAIDTDTLKDWEIIEWYEFFSHIDFINYIEHFYNLRLKAKETGDKANDLFSKLLMNALYGKFAANPEKYHKYEIWPMEAIGMLQEKSDEFGGLLGPWALRKSDLEEEEKHFFNIATAASITGYVRAYLWRSICQCGEVLYCDTDSIATADIGNIELGKELGQWEVEGEFSKAWIAGKKMYCFERAPGTYDPQKVGQYKMASKGVRLTPEQMRKVAEGNTVSYMPESPTYSVHKAPHFIEREIKATAKDVTILPEIDDIELTAKTA